MCWKATAEYIQPKMAEEDIPVFKIVTKHKKKRGMYEPLYYNGDVIYKRDNTYTHEDIVVEINNPCLGHAYAINEGLHCYRRDKVVFNPFVCVDSYGIPYGSPVWNTKSNHHIIDSGLVSDRDRLMDCIIPKGTTYYENEYGEIVTTCIKVVRIRKPRHRKLQWSVKRDISKKQIQN